jgi:membrane protein
LRVTPRAEPMATLCGMPEAGDDVPDGGRVHTGVSRTRRRVGVVVARHEGGLVLRVSRRMMAINGYDRALALAAQAFAGLIPVLVAVSALSPRPIRTSVGPEVIAALGVTGDAAAALTALVTRPPAVQPLTIVGGALLVLSVLGFTRALQRTYVSAWELPPGGLRGLGRGFLAAAALILVFAALVVVGPLLAVLDGHVVLALVANAVVATLLWWPVLRILVGGRVGWRALLPGAALNGCGQAVVFALSATYLPPAISGAAAEYGLIGVAVPVISWLVVLGWLLVLSAVLGAELVRGRSEGDGPAHDPDDDVEATRDPSSGEFP